MSYNTEKRIKIIDFLSANEKNSYSIEEICQSVLCDGHGKSTVYRQISALVKDGSVRRMTTDGERRVTYQYIDKDAHCEGHLHLKCKECGTLIHLSKSASEELENNIKSNAGFAIDVGTLLFGVCGSCAEAKA